MDLSELAIELFCQFDPDKKGYITKDQLLDGNNRNGPFSEVQIHSIFSLLDKDNKGVITLSDFTDAFLDVSDGGNQNEIEDYTNNTDDNDRIYCTDDVYDNEDDNINNDDVGDSRAHTEIYDHIESEYDPSNEEYDHSNEDIYNYLNKINDKPFKDRISQAVTRKFNSTESLLVKSSIYRTSSANECLDDGHLDEYWWEHGQRIDGLTQSILTRRDSLPSFNSISRKSKTNLLKAKQWRSYDCGIDRCFVASNNSAFKREPYKTKSYDDKKRDFNRILSKHNSTEAVQSHEHIVRTIKDKNLHQSGNQVSQEFDEIFGSTRQTVVRCSSCTGLNSESGSSDDNIYIQKIIRPTLKKFMSQSNSNLAHDKLNGGRSQQLLKTQSSLDLYDGKDSVFNDHNQENSPRIQKRKGYSSIENLLSRDKHLKNGFSNEHLSTSRDNLSEEWEAYLRRIGGVSLFAGNKMLRYLWQQLGAYQKDLMLPLEDFLKGVIEEHKGVYTRCQDLESTLHTKVEQHERDIDNLYEDFERTMQRELIQLEKKHTDREESLKAEFHRIIDLKEQVYQENLSYTAEITERLEHCSEEITDLQTQKGRTEDQYRQLVQEQHLHLIETDQMQEENHNLKQKNEEYQENIRDLQDYINQILKNAEEEKEKNRGFMRQFKDLLEEKEFLEANISNLSVENTELRNLNITLSPRDDDITESFKLLEEDALNRTPTNNNILTEDRTPVQPTLNQSMSLHDELNRPYEEEEEEEIFTADPLSSMTNGVENLEFENSAVVKDEEDTFDDSVDKSDEESDDDQVHTSTPRKSSAIRFASAVQSQFKVILCGDCGVGKTSIIHRVCFNKFSKARHETTQLDSYTKVIETEESVIKLNLWDTVGQERFNSIPRSYYRKSDVVILVYDISEESSFINARSWIRAVHDLTSENVLLLLVGHKSDLDHRRSVPREKGEMLAKDNDAIFIEASAKSGDNIQKMIDMISSTLLAQNEYVLVQNCFEQTIRVDDKFLSKQQCCAS